MKATTEILPDFLASRLDALQAHCRKYKVKYLWAIGSVLTKNFRNDSDIDLVYDLDRPSISDEEYLSVLDGFISGLLVLFSGRKIDLIHYPSLRNPYFIEEVNETKVILYEQRRVEQMLNEQA
ncbi:MAG: nucleotidyltransferase domain-containing protein [Bacteroidia bacterium]|nr:nucleotidyltransferase domain-containing protein [Bacteroidia bacterium]